MLQRDDLIWQVVDACQALHSLRRKAAIEGAYRTVAEGRATRHPACARFVEEAQQAVAAALSLCEQVAAAEAAVERLDGTLSRQEQTIVCHRLYE